MKYNCVFSFFMNLNIFAINQEQIVLTGNDFRPPKIYLNESKETKGDLIDALNIVTKDMNLSIKIELFPWLRAYNEALKGTYYS